MTRPTLDYQSPQPRDPRPFRIFASYAGGFLIGLFLVALIDLLVHPHRSLAEDSGDTASALSTLSVLISMPMAGYACLVRRRGPVTAFAAGLASCPLGLLVIIAISALRWH
jgi:hypothetical protein